VSARPVAPLAEQGVVVFGGSSGIGRAVAAAFRAEGARVCLVARNAERGARAAEALGADFVAADCADPDAAAAAVAEAGSRLGRIDTGLVSLGGNRLPELLHRQSLADIAATVTEDLTPTLLALAALAGRMREAGGGTLIAVASDAGKVATPGETVIGANMAAIIQFTRGLALEGRRDGIRANVLTPSLVEGTALTDRLMAEGTFSSKLFAKARPLAGLGPTGPEDLAALAVFLASPAAARITGQAISVNGGISAA
jgi:gluconate 5-dehydrogenase/3-oxoacyl-[acyl-carrier protein] reductase